MNLCVIAGRIIHDVTVKGADRKILRFTVETRDGDEDSESKERVNQVPCVVFNPSAELTETLTTNAEGLAVELHGRVASWVGEPNGRPNVEVVVFNRSLRFPKN